MICFPLDNTPYEAKDMGTYLATRTRGVFSSDGNLAVTPGESGLSVSVSPGLAWLKWSDYWGTSALQEQALTLNLDTADGALKRIDAIVCRLDKVNNRAEIVVKKGAPSSAPIVVPPVRDANYDELYIATVLIGAGVISISASAITDQRLNEEYCGLMRDGVTGIPTASLHAQAQQILTELTATLDAQIVQQSSEFDAWFEDLKGKLGEDPATALQQQVDNLNAAAVGDSFKLKGNPISIEAAGANRIDSLNLYGENAQGGTTEAPVALTGVDSVFVGGNNLLPKAVRTETTGGITFTPNPDGSILVSGTATTNVGYSYARFERALLGRTVCLSGGSTQAQVLINERLSSGAFVRNVLVDRGQWISGTLTKQKEDNILYASIQVLAGTTVNTTIYPMLNLGESPLPYEPYRGSVTPLPIPRPLRRVGDVKDKCVTRVKSVYDKRIVLSSADGFSFSSNAGNGYARFYKGYNSAKLSPIASDWLPGYAKTAYDATNEGVYSADSDAGTISIVLSIQRLIAAGATSGDTSTYLSAASAIFSAHPLTVYYQSTAYDGTNGLDVCLTEYQNDFVELDGTEASHIFEGMFYLDYSAAWPTPANRVNGVCSHYPYGAYGKGKIGLTDNGAAVVYNPNGDYTGDEGGLANWKAYLAAQKEAGTPVQVAYQLAAPEVYATDPLTIDNAAGPLNVMTGGELEVRMTELVGSRTYDADGDGVVDRAAAADRVAKKFILQNNAGQQMAEFDGSADRTVQLTPGQVGAEPAFTKNNAFNKNFGSAAGTVCQGNDGRLSNARRASNISMSLSGTTLTINYS